jgi:hypothetical protein
MLAKQFANSVSTDSSSVQLPDGMNSLLPSTILVRTGPYYQDLGCTNPATIEVHLVPSGPFLLSMADSLLTMCRLAWDSPERHA